MYGWSDRANCVRLPVRGLQALTINLSCHSTAHTGMVITVLAEWGMAGLSRLVLCAGPCALGFGEMRLVGIWCTGVGCVSPPYRASSVAFLGL